MSAILVQKYGGSSVADTERLLQVADRVVAAKQRGFQVVVVVSAMGDTTNRLMQRAREITPEPPRRELDMLLSAGERVSMALLSMAVQARGYEAISFTGSQSGILTNDRHFEAQIIEVRPIRIQDELARGKIVIVAGFQGMSYKREITTLGRGGSDTTAVALAGALGAEACEIYSDVDGVYDADPRVVLEARRMENLRYEDMEEMSRMGAKVLHAEAIRFAREHGIALYAKATSGGEGYTLIRRDFAPEDTTVRPAITCLRPLCWLSFPRAQINEETLQAQLAEYGLDSSMSFWGKERVELAFWRDAYPELDVAVQRLNLQADIEEVAVVSVVGSQAGGSAQALAHASQALRASMGAAPWRIWTAPLRLSFAVPLAQANDAQRALHRLFCVDGPPLVKGDI
ncbi:MAG: aspartate kinase [Myxococcales bacterium]|nr:aspartate kinase [Myxococcales bacterium]MCB9642940.1 aspartate kinase [Myxococcales bacterium]